MAWCETVEFGKGPCVGCLSKEKIEELGSNTFGLSGVEPVFEQLSNYKRKEDNDKTIGEEVKDEGNWDAGSEGESDDSYDYFEVSKAMGILDEMYNEPKSPLEAANVIASNKQSIASFGWRSGGVNVEYKCSERGGIVNKRGKSRFFLDRLNQDGSVMVKMLYFLLYFFKGIF